MKKSFLLLIFLVSISFNITANDNSTTEKTSLFNTIENWYAENMNYASITLLMTAESSILPVPSEFVIPPAVYVALSKPESGLNVFLIILFGTIGALIGATINYFLLGMLLGRTILYRFADSRFGHLLLLSGEKVKKAEDYFNAHGKTSTFIGRFIPVVRHLISIPAGFAKMNYPAFALFTFLGAGLWNCVLALLGYLAHGQAEVIDKYNHEISVIIVILACAVVGYYILKIILKTRKKA